MIKWIARAAMVSVLVALVAGASCNLPIGTGDNNSGDNNSADNNSADNNNADNNSADNNNDQNSDNNTNNDPTNDSGGVTVVKTAIPVLHDGGLAVGDDLIAFGTGTEASGNVGVSYVFPSETPTAGTPVASAELYDSSDFAVGGRYIFLAGRDPSIEYQVAVFNATTATTVMTFTTDEIRLASIPTTAEEPGNLQADGDYCAVICDTGTVTDGKALKVIDVSSGTPTLVTFDTDPGNGIQQVAVNSATKTVVAATSDTIYVYDISDPTAAPKQISQGMGTLQMKISSSYMICANDAGYEGPIIVNLATEAVTTLTDSDTEDGNAIVESAVGIGGTKFLFFSYATSDDAVGRDFRAAAGTVPGPTSTKAAFGQYIDGSYTGNGQKGFAQTVAIPADGSMIYIAGSGEIGSGEYLQYSTGSASFTVVPDPTGGDTYGIPATDVAVSDNTLGFKTGANTTVSTATTLGYAVR